MADSVPTRSARADYHRLIGQAVDVPLDALPTLSAHAQGVLLAASSQGWLRSPKDLLTHLLDRSAEADQPIPDPAMTVQLRLIHAAPTALIAGCWLAGQLTVEQSHTELGQLLLSEHFALCGQGHWSSHRSVHYRSILVAHGVQLHDPQSPLFARDPRFSDADFLLGTVLLQASRLGAAQKPEVIGVHAAMMLSETLLDVEHALPRSVVLQADRPAVVRKSSVPQLDSILTVYAQTEGADLARVLRGALWVLDAKRQWLQSLSVLPTVSVAQQMQDLVVRKLGHGYGFHRHVLLGARTMDSYWNPQHPQIGELLTALAESPWIVKGQPEQSPLLTQVTQFGGSMFGVFDDAELAVIARWIASLTDAYDHADRTPQPVHSVASLSVTSEPLESSLIPSREPVPRIALRQLYQRWLCPSKQPGSVAQARSYVVAKLSEVEHAGQVSTLLRQGLWPWSAQRLSAWVDARLKEQVKEESEEQDGVSVESLLTREEVIWLLLQLALAALIDGAWLQGTLRPSCPYLPPVTLLQKIYRDELGAGLCHQHHGNLMRKVLAAEGITLAAVDREEFVNHPQILSAAFSTPVLWLAYALHSQEFFPELLGLNLAIELAGVGSMYSRASRLLRRHQIDPYFFVLHNTIDNGASGHTAWSTEAIALYLDDIAVQGDASHAALCWQRIWRGFATYGQSSAPLLRAIALRIGPRLGYRWLRAHLGRIPTAEAS